ncbi:polysaccharide pyruvyl transferase family protein [Microbacterium sp. NPDC057407]|uniref:polysaccharide pyruvyl transferase family protein n=1 Tax=Microbacterium sp. NPDC057407 TaxID=3346120 RepID=UPI00366F56C9
MKRRELIYLGWQGNDNFGDELLYEAWKAALDRPLAITAPLTPRRYAVTEAPRFLRDRVSSLGAERLVLLGGGTTIGFGTWARHTRLARRMFAASGVIIPGAGAAERGDDALLSTQPYDWDAWRTEPDVALWGVRGPLTALECTRNWQPTGVIGDPALLYPLHREIDVEPQSTVGVCLGSGGRSAFDVATVAAAVTRIADDLGASITVFEVTPADAPVTNELAHRLGRPARLVRFVGDVHAMMREIAGCRLFFSERLHGAVAASSLRVPTVPLAYASKCDDYWLSVAEERPVIQPGARPSDIVTEGHRALAPAQRALRDGNVAMLQERLEQAASRIRGWLAGGIPTAELLAA